MLTSIIICTCNRADSLAQTLESLKSINVPEDLPAELILVDNASTDHTAEVVKSIHLPNMPTRYVYESRRGQVHARNTGITKASGEIILFTDDDVRPPLNWICGMSGPILSGKGSAVAGGVRLASHLERPWMTRLHRAMLASTEGIARNSPAYFIGANMAFSRQVLSKVPSFDPELGPGALGVCDDALFASQIVEAGYEIAGALDVEVEHHFQKSRLLRSSFESTAIKLGQSLAYMTYHWRHQSISFPRLRLFIANIKLKCTNTSGQRYHDEEGIGLQRLQVLVDVSFYEHYIRERSRPANYTKHGLVKLRNG